MPASLARAIEHVLASQTAIKARIAAAQTSGALDHLRLDTITARYRQICRRSTVHRCAWVSRRAGRTVRSLLPEVLDVIISIFGLGYVGTVSAACLSDRGHRVVGVDTNQHKVDAINQGTSPIVEPGLEYLLGRAIDTGRLTATRDATEAVMNSDLSLLCVGTPATPTEV